MRLLFLGDIVGRSGRTIIRERLPDLRKQLKLDFVIVNAENAAAGFGLTSKICNELFDQGVDMISGGNHSFDQKEIMSIMDSEPRILRPANFPTGTPGRGMHLYDAPRGKKVAVINVMGQVFMQPLGDPFQAVKAGLEKYRLSDNPMVRTADVVIVDIHGEATSEKMAMGHYCDGRASLVVGTHSHVPTADTQILDGGTAFQCDAGMCGDYNSVIGNEIDEPLSRFLTKINRKRYEPAKGPGTMSGVFIETDDKTGLAKRAEPLRIGARLIETVPEV